jgi:hypothetical protein
VDIAALDLVFVGQDRSSLSEFSLPHAAALVCSLPQLTAAAKGSGFISTPRGVSF